MAVLTARQHDNGVVDDERRSPHAPIKIARAGVLENVRAPQRSACGGVERAELARGTERVQLAVMPGRRRARTDAAVVLPERGAPRVGPQLAAGQHVVSGGDFVMPALLDGEGVPTCDDERRVAAADRLPPQRLQRRPVRANRPRGVVAVAARAAEVRPLRRPDHRGDGRRIGVEVPPGTPSEEPS